MAAFADEEAAKVLILLDLLRMGFRDQKAANRQVASFYDHLARQIYAEIVHLNPATFGEIRSLVDNLRESHYLDGPTGADWVFRNQLTTGREETLYVDYVLDEDGGRWVSPASWDDARPWVFTTAHELVAALHRCGCTRLAAFPFIERAWSRCQLEDATHWQVAAAINRAIVDQLVEGGHADANVSARDIALVEDKWPFPMGSLDLTTRVITREELDRQRERQHQRWLAEEYGDPYA